MDLPYAGDALCSMPMLQVEGIINTGIRGGLTVSENPFLLLVAFPLFLIALLGILLF